MNDDMVYEDGEVVPKATEEQRVKAAKHFGLFMKAIGIDPAESQHLSGTPRRVADSRIDELFAGLQEDPKKYLEKQFDAPPTDHADDSGMVIEDGISVESMCAHHLLPFRGEAHIGYIPRNEVTGLSKLARMVKGYARRPQVQENLTNQVADAVWDVLEPKGVAVVIEAEHQCMTMRGVRDPGTMTRSSALRGVFQNKPEARQEFFELVGDTA